MTMRKYWRDEDKDKDMRQEKSQKGELADDNDNEKILER